MILLELVRNLFLSMMFGAALGLMIWWMVIRAVAAVGWVL